MVDTWDTVGTDARVDIIKAVHKYVDDLAEIITYLIRANAAVRTAYKEHMSQSPILDPVVPPVSMPKDIDKPKVGLVYVIHLWCLYFVCWC